MLQWREEGDKLILILDGNENMKNGQLARMLRTPDLDMKDAIKSRSGMDGPATFVRGSRQIDAAWVTPDIEISAASFLPFFFGVGDHRAIMLDLPQHSLIGGNIHQISRQMLGDYNVIDMKFNKSIIMIWKYIALSTEYKRKSIHSFLQNIRQLKKLR